jgi:tetratricopeptide (TPR) repeat protein
MMLALYRDGRQGDALAAYQQARLTLVEELGAEPGPRLREMHRRVLAADPALSVTPPVPGAVNVEVVPQQLPAPVPHFSGRAKELAVLTRLLERNGAQAVVISAIDGTAGVGKTALAVHWAHRVAARFPSGQLYVNLRGYDPSGTPVNPEDAIRRLLDALGIPDDRIPSDPGARETLYRSRLAGRKMLIILDNARDAAQVRPLLPGSPGCMVVVTSRSQMATLAASPGAHVVTLDLLSEPDAHEMVTRRLGPQRVTDEPQAVSELIRLCARLPIAVSIAVARAEAHPTFPLADLVGQLRDETDRLDVLNTGDAASSVSAVFSWSYRNLGAPAALLFRLLSAHPGPDVTLSAATSLSGLPRDQARRALAELTGSHLLHEHAPGRFAFHDLLRAYAAGRARAQDSDRKRRAAVHRLLDHYLHTTCAVSRLLDPTRDPITLARPQPGTLPEAPADYGQAWAWADAEHPVLLAVVYLAAVTGFDAHAWQTCYALEPFFHRRGHWHTFAAAQRIAMDAARRLGDVAGLAYSHRGLGRTSAYLGSVDDAEAHLSEAIAGFRRLGNRTDEARARIDIGVALRRQGRYNDALGHEQEALRLYRAASHQAGEAGALNNIGFCHIYMGNYQEALSCCQQALSIFSELGDRYGEAHAHDSLGYAYHRLGEYAQAISCYQQAIAAFRERSHRYGLADSMTHLGDTYHATGNTQAARQTWQAALDILADISHADASQVRAKLQKIATPSAITPLQQLAPG